MRLCLRVGLEGDIFKRSGREEWGGLRNSHSLPAEWWPQMSVVGLSDRLKAPPCPHLCLLSATSCQAHGLVHIMRQQGLNTLMGYQNITYVMHTTRASLVSHTVKNLPAMWETQVPSLGWEVSLEKGMATNPSIFAWRIPWTEEPGGL